MSKINEQIERLRGLIRKCYGAVATKLGDVPSPEDRTMENLPTAISSIKHLDQADLDAAYDAFKGGTGMIPKEEQTIGNLKYAIRMNQEEMDVNEINFVDFNGMVLSMTIEEAMQLTELPKPREYYNLTFEKWSETLEEIQDGRCHTVGAFYHTTDGCNYYVVDVKAGNNITMKEGIGFIYHWGDGTTSQSGEAGYRTHTYEKAGRYVIKLENPGSNIGFYEAGDNKDAAPFMVEVYMSDKYKIFEPQTFRTNTKLRKISLPSTLTSGKIDSLSFPLVTNLKSLVLPDAVIFDDVSYSGTNNLCVEYLVANGQGMFSLPHCTNLKCFSCKNVTTSEVMQGYAIMPRLKNIVFDKIETIISGVIPRGSDYRDPCTIEGIIDLPETLKSIGNNSLRTCPAHVYLRTLTPPTLGGTSVFWWNNYGIVVTIHIRKDATYTDANGYTWTGLEAYAHATNWATLYASSNFTFIDDL